MATLTIFTPTYNRAHTLTRTYESLCRQTNKDFEWMVIDDGSTDSTRELIHSFIEENKIPIQYIYKENGGLYTGYNTAYANIETELNVCVDSDDYMPKDAVNLILNIWSKKGSKAYAGIIGLDYSTKDSQPIGGKFPKKMKECYFLDLYTHRIHLGDTKLVMRTDLMKEVAPQIGFLGEKNFNPVYMLLQVCDCYPLLVLNENLCWVEYQEADSMSHNIYRQYIDSPRSFAKTRIMEMQLRHNTFLNKVRSAIHYVAECILAQDKDWLKKSPIKWLTILVWPIGGGLSIYIRNKAN